MSFLKKLPTECLYNINDFIYGSPIDLYKNVIEQINDLNSQFSRKKYISSVIISLGIPNSIGSINWNNLWYILIYKKYFIGTVATHMKEKKLSLFDVHKIFVNFEILSRV